MDEGGQWFPGPGKCRRDLGACGSPVDEHNHDGSTCRGLKTSTGGLGVLWERATGGR